RPGPPELLKRLPLWLESLLFLLLAALGTASLRLPTLARCLLGPLLIIAALALSIALLRYQGSWAPFTPLLACTSLTWLLTTYLHHKITPQEQPS
ncbi:MAG: hypothetical protein O3A92_13565, partial [Verrucomicrobia bacterium]|nr:hypothetical protein [Verrucomicrobiota bacterium]